MEEISMIILRVGVIEVLLKSMNGLNNLSRQKRRWIKDKALRTRNWIAIELGRKPEDGASQKM